MSRLKRLEEFRFIGVRDTMTVYDTDDEEQASSLRARVESEDLVNLKLVQTFGPDSETEARNRGFKPA